MKKINKYVVCLALSALTGLFFAFSADAQRRGGGGGGGGFRGGSGGGFSGRSGGGFNGGGGFSGRSGGSFNGGGFSGRSGGGFSGRSYTPRNFGGGAPRGNFGGSVSPRGNYGGGNRQGFATRPNFNNRGGFGARGNYSYRGNAGRSYGFVRPGSRYNVAPRSFYYGRPYLRGGVRSFYGRPSVGLYYNYRGYYNRYYHPRIGFSIGVLPFGYYPFSYGPYQYFYSDGYYYQQQNDQYTVVEPPIGAEIDRLPQGAESIMIDGQQYYELNGVYYLPIVRANGAVVYRIAGKDGELDTNQANEQVGTADQGDYPQVGDVIDELPSDSRKVTLNGEKFYVTPDGVYLKEQRDANGKKIYVVASVPDEEYDEDQQQ